MKASRLRCRELARRKSRPAAGCGASHSCVCTACALRVHCVCTACALLYMQAGRLFHCQAPRQTQLARRVAVARRDSLLLARFCQAVPSPPRHRPNGFARPFSHLNPAPAPLKSGSTLTRSRLRRARGSYDGNLEEDLCLTFSVDEEAFGQRTAVELRAGGRVTAVTKENRIEYIHLMADYRLNRQLAAQSKAFVDGLHDVVPTGWLRLFSAPELQRLINGDDAPVNVADLRKHTKYYGGYTDFSPTVRDFWSVLQEFSAEVLLSCRFLQPPPPLTIASMHVPTGYCAPPQVRDLVFEAAFAGVRPHAAAFHYPVCELRRK